MLTPPRDRRPDTGMIRSFLVINNLGKPRLTRSYKHESLERQQLAPPSAPARQGSRREGARGPRTCCKVLLAALDG